MRKYLIAITVLVTLLILAMTVYTTLDSVRRIDKELEMERERVTMQLVDYINTSLAEVAVTGTTEFMEGIINPELFNSANPADQLRILQFVMDMLRAQYSGDYLAFISDGVVLIESVKEGLDIPDLPSEMPEEGYEVLSELGGRKGTFISVFHIMELSPLRGTYVDLVVDRTEEFNAMEDFYSQEKSSLVTRQIVTGIIALAVALLITTLGVYFLTRRYITAPIATLTKTSHGIMDGTFEGEVEVVEDSDYVDIQRLLQSGKVLMEKMEEVEE
jgi:ethanolamine utilization protein EutA (predicted chaperonin)